MIHLNMFIIILIWGPIDMMVYDQTAILADWMSSNLIRNIPEVRGLFEMILLTNLYFYHDAEDISVIIYDFVMMRNL